MYCRERNAKLHIRHQIPYRLSFTFPFSFLPFISLFFEANKKAAGRSWVRKVYELGVVGVVWPLR